MFKLKSNTNLHFIIIGTGGTGGYLIENLARLINVTTDAQKLYLTILDGDTVESKNLVRQNFYESDLGKNKAHVLYERYRKLYPNLTSDLFKSGSAYLQNKEQLETLCGMYPQTIPVIIGAVDNNATRHIIQDTVKSAQNAIIWLDAGNEERAGQAIMGTNNIATASDNASQKYGITNQDFSTAIDLHPTSFPNTDKLPTDLSCAEHAISAPQNIAANITSATLLFNLANKLIAGEVINKNEYTFDTAFINIK